MKTALAEDDSTTPVRIALMSCIGLGSPLPFYVDPDDVDPTQFPITDVGENLDYDVIVHVGDQGYMDTVWSKGGSYQQYLDSWGAYHGGGYRKVYPKAGLYSTWDDHEVVDNGTVDPWTNDAEDLEKIETGKRAYFTVLPIEPPEPDVFRVWRSFQWGKVVEFVLIDCRYERTPDDLMSQEQLDWLIERIQSSPCRFVCICTDKPYANVRMVGNIAYPGGGERWQGNTTQRDQIRAAVNDNDIRNVFWITGDIHMTYVGRADLNDDSAAGRMWEVCTTSGNTNPLGELLSGGQFDYNSQNPHMPILTFDPVSEEIIVEFYGTNGQLAFETALDYSE